MDSQTDPHRSPGGIPIEPQWILNGPKLLWIVSSKWPLQVGSALQCLSTIWIFIDIANGLTRVPYFMSIFLNNFTAPRLKNSQPILKVVVLRMGWVYASCGSKEEIQQFSTEGHFTLESPVLMRCIYSAAAPIKSPVFSFRFLYAEQWDQVTMP